MMTKYTNREKLIRARNRLEKLKANASYGKVGEILGVATGAGVEYYDYVSAYPERIDVIDTEGVEVTELQLPESK